MSGKFGIVYDARMLQHKGQDSHPERPERIQAIYDHLVRMQFLERKNVVKVESREITDEELRRCHEPRYLEKIRSKLMLCYTIETERNEQVGDMFASAGSYLAARLSAGCAVALADSLLSGQIASGFAICRPPGHHSKCGGCGGFCYYNNGMLCATKLTDAGKKVQVVDWDCHRGDGSIAIMNCALQKENQLLRYFSIHRWDNGMFYPGGDEGKTGISADGRVSLVGFNGPKGDDYYLQAFLHEFSLDRAFIPDVIVVSAGFDAALGDPVGQCYVTEDGFRALTQILRRLCPNILMILEGGYNLKSLAECSFACMDELESAIN